MDLSQVLNYGMSAILWYDCWYFFCSWINICFPVLPSWLPLCHSDLRAIRLYPSNICSSRRLFDKSAPLPNVHQDGYSWRQDSRTLIRFSKVCRKRSLSYNKKNAHFPTRKTRTFLQQKRSLSYYKNAHFSTTKTLTFLQQKLSLFYNKNAHFPTTKTLTFLHEKRSLSYDKNTHISTNKK